MQLEVSGTAPFIAQTQVEEGTIGTLGKRGPERAVLVGANWLTRLANLSQPHSPWFSTISGKPRDIIYMQIAHLCVRESFLIQFAAI